MTIELIGLEYIPLVKKGDDISSLILDSLKKQDLKLEDGDIILIAETIVSKAEGNMVDLKSIVPSEYAISLADKTNKDAKLVELILQESNEVINLGPNFIITETKHGFVCANAGIDESNIENSLAKPLPENPDRTAKIIREKLEDFSGKKLGVIITDTQGRAFRFGAVGTSIGCSGLKPLWKRIGDEDLYGREMQSTEVGISDELASAASLVQGHGNEGIPIVLIRGFKAFNYIRDTEDNVKSLLLPKNLDVFRKK